MSYEPQFNRLRIYNVFMGCLHLVQAGLHRDVKAGVCKVQA